MKQLLFICTIALLAACNNAGTTETKKDSTATAMVDSTASKKTIPNMPYQLGRPYQNWQMGDANHAVTAMTALKAFETGDVAKAMGAFADSVKLSMDNVGGMFSRDSLTKMFTGERANIASMSIKMDDWESVISEDKKEEWVTLWYKQIWTDKKGKTDSLACIDDFMMKDGKIALLSEAIKHYPKK